MQLEELEKRTSQLQLEADALLKAQQALYVNDQLLSLFIWGLYCPMNL